MSDHQPVRGSWICIGCASPWPCPTRRRQLLAQYTGAPVSLALVLGAALVEACGDLAHVPAGDLHARFVGWLRPPRT
ncbi:flavin reductase [Planosporangium sp. 12N6]|uniref:flavin reductase n=1 Tax=Planosporangium spinosum TaxID=3402278 RepID=UPI003CF7DD3C